MFHVLISPGIVFDRYDSAAAGWSVAAGSTTTVIQLSTTFTGNPDGYEFVLVNGSVAGRGSVVLSHTTDGSGYVDSVTLADPLPSAPSSGDRFFFLYKRSSGMYADTNGDFFVRVTGLQYSSRIDGGFDKATVRGVPASALSVPSESLVGSVIDIYDDGGFWVWSGLIQNVSSSGREVEFGCIGFIETYRWYDYPVAWALDGNTTTKNVLIDIVKSNPWVANNYALIDPDGDIHSAQSAAGGIGPFRWDEDKPTAYEAIKDVEKVGAMPHASNPVLFQQWGRGASVLHEFEYWTVTPKWYLARRDVDSFSFTRLDVSMGLGGNYTRSYVKYTEDGEALQTSFLYKPHDYYRLGKKEKGFSYGDTTGDVADMIAEILAGTGWLNYVGGRVSVKSERIRAFQGAATSIPSYAVRPGEVLDIASVMPAGSGLGSRFVIGEVRVSWPSLSVEYVAYSPAFSQEIVAQYLEVD